MPNFSALILFESSADGGSKEPLYEERVYLIEARDDAEAWIKAEDLARGEGVSFKNADQQQVRWSALKVLGIEEIHDDVLRHGTELFSRYLRDLGDYGRIERRAQGLDGRE